MPDVQHNPGEVFDPMLAVHAWRVRWRLSSATFLTFTLMVLLVTASIRPNYESEASLYVRLGRESAGLDPTATTAEVAPIYETREQELNSALEVMQSRKLLEAVISVIGEEVILQPKLFSVDQWQQSLAETTWPELDPAPLHRSDAQKELAVDQLYRSMTLEVEQSSNVIGITSTADTPELAQAITRTMLDAFRAEHVRLNQTRGLEFFQTQARLISDRLDLARIELAERKNDLEIMSVEGERTRLEDVLTALEKQLNAVTPELDGAKASVAVMEQQVASLPDRTQPHDATDTLKKTLHELEQKQAILLTKFTDRHFRVRDVQTELDLVRKQLVDPSNRNAANPTLRELEVALANERTRVAQTAATIAKLQSEQATIRRQLLSLNDAEAEMQSLQDRVDELKAASNRATEKLEQARILDELSRQRISNIRVVQPPTFNPISMSPSRTLTLIFGLIVASLAAAVLPAIAEFAAWYLRVLRSSAGTEPDRESKEGPVVCGG